MAKGTARPRAHRFAAYGLCLESNTPLAGLAQAGPTDVADLFVTLEDGDAFSPDPTETLYYVSDWLDEPTGQPGLRIWRSSRDGAFTFRYAEGVEFRIDAFGRHVDARFAAHSCLADMTSFLTGPVFGFVLRMRGIIALHANAIDVGHGRAIVLAGDASAGKSTTAVTFARLGYKILTEDVAALSRDGGGIAVNAGCTEIALRPDAVEYLYGSPEALPKFSDNWEKRRFDVAAAGAYSPMALRVAAVYMLTNHGEVLGAPCVHPLASRDAIMELLANVYANRLLHRELRLRELDILHHLVSTVPVKAAVTGGRSIPVERFCKVLLDDVRAC